MEQRTRRRPAKRYNSTILLLGIVLGLSLGLLMVRFKDRWGDRLGTGYILMVRAIPNLIYLFFIQIWSVKSCLKMCVWLVV